MRTPAKMPKKKRAIGIAFNGLNGKSWLLPMVLDTSRNPYDFVEMVGLENMPFHSIWEVEIKPVRKMKPK